MSTPLRRVYVSESAIRSNVERLRQLAPTTDTMVVVKANGYGHGAEIAARAAINGGATWIGVADIDEARHLRDAGVTAPILAWLLAPDDDFTGAIRQDITLGVSTIDQINAIATVGGGTVHLKIDTGLGRNGASHRQLDEFLEAAAAAHVAGSLVVDGLMSHVSGASREADLSQAEIFVRTHQRLAELDIHPRHLHLAASAAAIDHPSLRFTMVRFGITAYGLDPTTEHADLGLTPAMRFESSVINVKRLHAGDSVSYNFLWTATNDTTVALVAAGYADGIPRAATGRARVDIGGVQYPVVGRIAMDQLVVDVGDADVNIGNVVRLWGNSADGTPSVSDWAEWADTITYEIVTGIGGRVARIDEP